MRIPRPERTDVVLAAALGAAVELELALSDVRDTPLLGALLLGLGLCAPLAWRRVAPLGALAATAAGAIALSLTQAAPEDLVTTSMLVAVLSFSLGAHLRRRRALAGLAGVLALVLVVGAMTGHLAASDTVLPVVVFGGCWALGRVARGRARLTAELTARTEQLERERRARARRARARRGGARAGADRARAARRRRPLGLRHGRAGRGRPARARPRPRGLGRCAGRGRGDGTRGADRDAPPAGRPAPRRPGRRPLPAALARAPRSARRAFA